MEKSDWSERRKRCLEVEIIQGGMGAGVSNYNLANEVARQGQGKTLGVVSGVALNEIMVRRLQNGDPNGDVRWALSQFPDENIAEWILKEYFIPDGKSPSDKYHGSPFPRFKLSGVDQKEISIEDKNLQKLIVAANFCEVVLAKRGHDYPIGINYLFKIQWPLLPSIYGAMLAGVDVTLIGAGFPNEIPAVFDEFTKEGPMSGLEARLSVPVNGGDGYKLRFDPIDAMDSLPYEMKKPLLFGIVANHLGVKALPKVDGYVFENYIAGGHNAPAREKEPKSNGEPNYGPKDEMNEKLLASLLAKNSENREGKPQPYWYAGGYASKLETARARGAVGVQVGSPFAFCRESAIDPELKRKSIVAIMNGANVYTSPQFSPSGFPFKVLQIPGTLSEESIVASRQRGCDLGYLFEFFKDENHFSFRCPAESIGNYVRKGGSERDTNGRVCLCNALVSTIGLGSPGEIPVITSGSDLTSVKAIVARHGLDYGAKEVIDYMNNPY